MVNTVDARLTRLGFRLFDADNHYYESEDALLRHMDPRLAHKAPRWVQTSDGMRRIVFGDRMNRFVGADHTFAVVTTFHAADDPYRRQMGKLWGWGNVNVPAVHIPPMQRLVAGRGRPCHDTFAALIHGKLFERFPTLRFATIELGSEWVRGLLRGLEDAGRGELTEDPVETFRRHVWVNPFDHEDLLGLADLIGVDRLLFGSDFPHHDGSPSRCPMQTDWKDSMRTVSAKSCATTHGRSSEVQARKERKE